MDNNNNKKTNNNNNNENRKNEDTRTHINRCFCSHYNSYFHMTLMSCVFNCKLLFLSPCS